MQPISVVIAQPDLGTASQLAATLRKRFRTVSVTQRKENVRAEILHSRATLAVVDLELIPLPEVEELCRELSNVRIVCTHRLADNALWTAVVGSRCRRLLHCQRYSRDCLCRRTFTDSPCSCQSCLTSLL